MHKKSTDHRQSRLEYLENQMVLTTDEKKELNVLTKLEKNRRAAAMSRIKKKNYINGLENSIKSLHDKIHTLEIENTQLKTLLMAHGICFDFMKCEKVLRLTTDDLPPPPPPPPPSFGLESPTFPPLQTVDKQNDEWFY